MNPIVPHVPFLAWGALQPYPILPNVDQCPSSTGQGMPVHTLKHMPVASVGMCMRVCARACEGRGREGNQNGSLGSFMPRG